MYRTDLFTLVEKENLTDNIKLSGLPDIVSKYTINHVFKLHDTLINLVLLVLLVILLPSKQFTDQFNGQIFHILYFQTKQTFEIPYFTNQ